MLHTIHTASTKAFTVGETIESSTRSCTQAADAASLPRSTMDKENYIDTPFIRRTVKTLKIYPEKFVCPIIYSSQY